MVNNVVPAHVLFLFGNPMQRYCYFLCYANYLTQKWNTNRLKNRLIDSVLYKHNLTFFDTRCHSLLTRANNRLRQSAKLLIPSFLAIRLRVVGILA